MNASPQSQRAASRLLTPAEVIELLAITESHFRKLIFYRNLPSIRVGRLVRIRPGDLERWLTEHSVPAREG